MTKQIATKTKIRNAKLKNGQKWPHRPPSVTSVGICLEICNNQDGKIFTGNRFFYCWSKTFV